jgi:CRP-like cAMP-binding protein
MYVENSYLFQGMKGPARSKILEAGLMESYAAGDFIFRHGDHAHSFYILSEGRVRLSMGPEGLLAYVADPGDLIGWSSLVGNDTYAASAECLTAVNVLKVEKSQLDQILHTDPESGMTFFKNLAALVGRRLANAYKATLALHGERHSRPGG